MAEGGLEAVRADEDVVAASRVRELEAKVRELERLLGRKTMEAEIFREALEAARPKNVWPAPSASDFAIRSVQSTPTYPVSEQCPGQDGDPRALVLINSTASCAIFLARFPGRRSTVRPSRFHHPQTSSVAHAASARAADPAATTPSQPPSRTAFRCGGPRRRSATAWPPARPRRCSHAPAPTGHAAIRPAGSLPWTGSAGLRGHHGSASCAGRHSLAC